MNETKEYIERFTNREEGLLARLPEGHSLPPVLHDWRMWIQDSTIYLDDLRYYVETFERGGPPRCADDFLPLTKIRKEWEAGLTVLSTIDRIDEHGNFLVVLADRGEEDTPFPEDHRDPYRDEHLRRSYHLHRYFTCPEWKVSVDGAGVKLETVWEWLSDPRAMGSPPHSPSG